jgi:kumamolisin
VTAALAEKLFSAPLARFHTAREGPFIAPTAAVKLPRPLRGRTTGVVGLDTRPLATPPRPPRRGRNLRAHAAGQPSSALPRTGTPFGCPGGLTAGERGGDPATAGFTPNQYLAAYGFTQLQQSGFTGQGERVALIEIDGFKASDVSTFAQCFGLTVPPLNGFGVGLSHPLPPGGESTLDLELLDAAAPGLEAIDVYESRANAADTLSALTAPLQNRRFRPQVISASLGLCEPAVLGVVGLRGVLTTEAALQMAAISGITFLASSGDQGSADCTGPDGLPIHQLAVNYPASSPWTTGRGRPQRLVRPAVLSARNRGRA